MKDPYIKIKNLSKFAKFLATTVAKDCGLEIDKVKVNDFITLKNVKGIIRQYAKVKNEELFINTKILLKINDELLSWILGVSLAKAASNGELECYWDDLKNCMMFKKGKINGKETF